MNTESSSPTTSQLHRTLARIKDLLARLPSDYAADYLPNPCLTVADLVAWEAANSVTLPEAYRLFLLEIGNGGTLPCDYSQFDFWPLAPRKVDENPREPFPITRERFAQRMAIPLRERSGDDQYLFPELRQYANEEIPPGCLLVARYPSWESIFLVVTGELRGTVWMRLEWETPEVDRQEQPFDVLGWFEDVLLDVI
jgi:hypothetical protein